MLNNIKIILIGTSHSGNIGSTARAMKTMGLTQLRLVSPKQGIDEQAESLSAGAKDVLDNAQVFSSFDEAIADCQLIIGTSARLRHLQSTLIEPRECGKLAIQHALNGNVALVFGRERIGLTNEELLKCHYHLTIPANLEYSSLNLAMAVQLVCYEIRMAWLEVENLRKNKLIQPLDDAIDYPTHEALEHFFAHTEKVYKTLGFIHNDAVMLKLRRLYQRAKLERNELNLLRGMLTSIEKMQK